MEQGSMDTLFGSGPWTIFMDRAHGPPVIDQVHGHFFIFIRRFCARSMDTQKTFDETVDQCSRLITNI